MKKLKRKVSNLLPSFAVSIGKEYAFWICFFAFTRLVFLLYNLENLKSISGTETAMAFINGLYLDFSMAGYFMVLPLLLSGISLFTHARWIRQLRIGFQSVLIVVVSCITIAELPIYSEWSHKLTFKALWFLQNPSEVYHTASVLQFWGGLFGILILSYSGIRLYHFLTKPSVVSTGISGSAGAKISWLFIWLGFTVTCMRGGYDPIPAQVSDAYYSRHDVLNAASANSSFHLLSNVLQNLEAHKPYQFLHTEQAKTIVDNLYTVEKDTTIFFLKTQKPNVILVVLEGWSADVVSTLGGFDGIAPHFSKMAAEGISFDSCYASGNLSDQGMGAVFSAFPAQPRTSIVALPEKYVHLPCINSSFLNEGYKTSFMFGGQLSYGNIKSYMYFNKFHRIVEEKDFGSSIYRGRLGVHDGDLFNQQIKELKQTPEPFFAALFTLSTHGPYDFKGGRPLNWGGDEQNYINAVHYADSCLNQFMIQARQQPWFNNTLFVFVSDHHHRSPKAYSYYHPEYRRIPLVFYGNVIKDEFVGYKDKQVCSQLDLANTLLKQLHRTTDEFVWSKNLFNPYTKRFAFYCFDEGFGWIKPEGRLVWFADGRIEAARFPDKTTEEQLLKEGKAYLQRVTEAFWQY